MRPRSPAVLARICAAFACAALVLLPAAAFGSENSVFGVEAYPKAVAGAPRRTLDVKLDAGREIRDGVRVWNRTSATITLRIYAADAQVQPDGIVAIGSASPSGPAKRIELSKDRVRLGPRKDAIVGVTIPRGTFATTDQMGAVVAEQVPDDAGAGIDLVQRIALLVRPRADAPVVDDGRARARTIRLAAIVAVALLLLAGAIVAGTRRRRRADDPRPAVPEPVREPEPVRQHEPVPVAAAVATPSPQPIEAPEPRVGAPAPRPPVEAPARRPARRAPRKRDRKPPPINYIPLR